MAARFWVAGGTGNWNSTTNWSTTSGGASGASFPTVADDVTFDGNGNANATVNTTAACLSLTITAGYTSTITFNAVLSVSGNITLNTGVTFAGAQRFQMIATGTWTSNGKTVNVPVTIGSSATATMTCTLGDDLNIAGDLLLSAATSTTFAGAFNITATSATIQNTQTVTLSGNVTIAGLTSNNSTNTLNGAFNWSTLSLTMGTSTVLSGTATIVFNGTGTWQATNTTTVIQNNITIAAGAGTLTISGTLGYNTGTLTYTSGTVVTTGLLLNVVASTTFDTAGMSWNDVTLTGAITITLNSLWTLAGTLTVPNNAITFAGTDGWTVGTLLHLQANADRIFTFAAGETYTITTSYTAPATSSPVNTYKYVSSSPGTAVNFVLQAGAAQNVGFVDPTDMDATGGDEIFTYNGVITSSPNWTNVYAGGGGGGGGTSAYAYAG